MGHLFPDQENPLTYIACTETHAQAVVDGTLHDIRDRRNLGDQPAYRSESALTELWLKCDDPAVLEEVPPDYCQVRRRPPIRRSAHLRQQMAYDDHPAVMEQLMDHLPPRDEKCPEHDTEPSTKNPQLPGHDQRPERLLGGPNCS